MRPNKPLTFDADELRAVGAILGGLCLVVAIVGGLYLSDRSERPTPTPTRTAASPPLPFIAYPGAQAFPIDQGSGVYPPGPGEWRSHVSGQTVILKLADDHHHYETRREASGSGAALLSTGTYEIVHNAIRFDDANEGSSQHGYAQIIGSDPTHLALKNPWTGAIAVFIKEAS